MSYESYDHLIIYLPAALYQNVQESSRGDERRRDEAILQGPPGTIGPHAQTILHFKIGGDPNVYIGI